VLDGHWGEERQSRAAPGGQTAGDIRKDRSGRATQESAGRLSSGVLEKGAPREYGAGMVARAKEGWRKAARMLAMNSGYSNVEFKITRVDRVKE
jgi:hypothetical protein